jgi:ribosomal protein S18 acetylase RimI-like enzyme
MNIVYKFGFEDDWLDQIITLHNKTEMRRDAAQRDKYLHAYKCRHTVVTAWLNETLAGFGSMISDGTMYSSIFDIVVDPELQRRGVGREIVNRLLERASGTCVHLTSTFGNERFYENLGFKRHKTAFAKYPWKSDYLEE